jgi:hypothetical protein
MPIILMAIVGLEKDITSPRMTPLWPSLLENMQVLLCLVLKMSVGILNAKAIKESLNFLTKPA